MEAPAVPEREGQRLAALDSLDLLYTPAEERFDRITRMACKLFDVPIALVTFVAAKCQWFKSAQGLDAPETPREISFCGHAILGNEAFVVEDASIDTRFLDNPLVTGSPNIRFYAGYPIHAGDGSAIGTVCVIDRKRRNFSPRDQETLRDLAAMIETELQRAQLSETQRELIERTSEAERKASIDGLTRLWNRETITELLRMEISKASRGKPLSIAMIDVDHFKTVNDTRGHQAGDRVLAGVASSIRESVRDFDAVGRYGGDEFISIHSDCRVENAVEICDRMHKNFAQKINETSGARTISLSIGVASYSTAFATPEDFIAAADDALYKAKKAGRNQTAVASL